MSAMDVVTIRKGMNLTQAEFAALVGISHKYVGHLETGHRKLSLKVAAKIEARTGKTGLIEAVVAEKTAGAH